MEYTISETARRTGFSSATLRYYEDIGLLPSPGRTASGYRAYDDRDVERLRFIARAKHLGCTLEEITLLVDAWDSDECEPVKDNLGALLQEKVVAARQRAANETAFAVELAAAAAALTVRHAAGGCDDDCACNATVEDIAGGSCTLDPGQRLGRAEEWHSAIATTAARAPLPNGIRLEFGAESDRDVVAELARLAVAENECCSFFGFALTVDGRGVGFEVTAPAEHHATLMALFS